VYASSARKSTARSEREGWNRKYYQCSEAQMNRVVECNSDWCEQNDMGICMVDDDGCEDRVLPPPQSHNSQDLPSVGKAKEME